MYHLPVPNGNLPNNSSMTLRSHMITLDTPKIVTSLGSSDAGMPSPKSRAGLLRTSHVMTARHSRHHEHVVQLLYLALIVLIMLWAWTSWKSNPTPTNLNGGSISYVGELISNKLSWLEKKKTSRQRLGQFCSWMGANFWYA